MRRSIPWLALLLVTAVVAKSVQMGFTVTPATPGSDASAAMAQLRPWITIGCAYVLLVVFALRWVWRDDRRELTTWFRPNFGDFTSGVLGAVALFGLVYAGQRLVTPAGSAREAWLVRLYLMLGDPALLRAHVTLVILALVLIAAAEEIVWRGFVQRLTTALLGDVAGIGVAAALYALAHLPAMYALSDGTAGLNPLLPAAALLGGLVWGAMVRMSKGRLVPVIVAHALFDWCVIMQFRLWGPSV